MPGARNAVERAVKIDVATDRRIAQLAFFMDVPKKEVVREAVAEYAEARLPRSSAGVAGTAEGVSGRAEVNQPADVSGRSVVSPRGDTDAGGDAPADAAAMTFEDLPIRDRLALSRGQLIREFAARGGTGVRVMDPPDLAGIEGEDEDASEFGDRRDEIELLVDTRLEDGSGAAVMLAGIARSILKEYVEVTSLTAVRLNRPWQLDDLVARSRPL